LKKEKAAEYLRNYRAKLKSQSLELHPNDFKRYFVQEILGYITSHNWGKVKLFLEKHNIIPYISLFSSFK
jgi:hypothetical protein